MGRAVELVGIQVAQDFLGMDSERISEMIEEGKLIWVWDFASKSACSRRWRRSSRPVTEGVPTLIPGTS